MAGLTIAACQRPEIVPVTPDEPDTPVTPDPPTPDPPTPDPPTPVTPERWEDTGADLPDYPTYNKVSSLADFPRIDITWEEDPANHRLAEGEFEYVNGTIKFSDPKGMYMPEEKEEFDFDNTSVTLQMMIRGRGNTSWDAEGGIKHSYRIKLMDNTSSIKEPHKLFGMKKDSDWYLLSDIQDPTLLRNAVALRIGRMVSMSWTPKYRCVELYRTRSNGQSRYMGCYLLVEAKEADRDSKVPITVVEKGQVDGGYLLEIDNKQDYDRSFKTAQFDRKIKFKEPDFGNKNNPDNSESATAQMEFITSYVNNFEKLLTDCNFDPETGYRSVIETRTFIDNYIVQEVMKNVDGGMRLSTYFAKDSDTKLFMPMVWDFDLTLGNYNSNPSWDFNLSDGNSPQGWLIRLRGGDFLHGDSYAEQKTYYQYLFEDPLFVQDLKDRWEVVKPRLDKIPVFIDKMVEYNQLAYDHNRDEGFNPRAEWGGSGIKSFGTWKEAVTFMSNFYTQRIQWLDTNIKNLKAQYYNKNTGEYEDL